MKWKNRLQAVLTKNASPENFNPCLKTLLRITAETKLKIVSAVIRSSEFRYSSKITNELADIKSEIPQPIIDESKTAEFKKADSITSSSFFERRAMLQSFQPKESISRKLDAMIEAGAAFDVTEDSFKIIGGKYLTDNQQQYLITNEKEVLCTLHQRLLMKYLFYDSTELLESFAFDIFERESLMAEETGVYNYETYFETISEASRKWFANLLDSATDNSNL